MFLMNSPGRLFFIHAVICDRCVGRQFDIWKSPLGIFPIPFFLFPWKSSVPFPLTSQHHLPTIKPFVVVIAIYSAPYTYSDYVRGVKTCSRGHIRLQNFLHISDNDYNCGSLLSGSRLIVKYQGYSKKEHKFCVTCGNKACIRNLSK